MQDACGGGGCESTVWFLGATRALLALASCARHVLAEREFSTLLSMPIERTISSAHHFRTGKPHTKASMYTTLVSPFPRLVCGYCGFRTGPQML